MVSQLVLAILLSHLLPNVFAQGLLLPNEYCRPRPTLVDIDRPNYNYFPYVVELNRCGGSCNSIAPNIKHCVPTSSEDVSLTVFSPILDKLETILVKNHTSCGCQCVARPSDCDPETQIWKPNHCRCECNKMKVPSKCPIGLKWDSEKCKCVCAATPKRCPINKMWSTEKCACVCRETQYNRCAKLGKLIDEEDCGCLSVTAQVIGDKGNSNNGVSKEYLMTVLGIQFLVLFLVFDCILYTKQAGLTYTVRRCLGKKLKSFDSTAASETSSQTSSQHSTWESTENIMESELPPATNTLPRPEP